MVSKRASYEGATQMEEEETASDQLGTILQWTSSHPYYYLLNGHYHKIIHNSLWDI